MERSLETTLLLVSGKTVHTNRLLIQLYNLSCSSLVSVDWGIWNKPVDIAECGLIVQSLETKESGSGKKGERRLYCVPVLAFSGVTWSRPWPRVGQGVNPVVSPRQSEPMQSRRFQRETIGTARVNLGLIWHILRSMTTNIDEEVHCRSCCRLFLRSSLNLCRQGRVATPREFKN